MPKLPNLDNPADGQSFASKSDAVLSLADFFSEGEAKVRD